MDRYDNDEGIALIQGWTNGEDAYDIAIFLKEDCTKLTSVSIWREKNDGNTNGIHK